MPTLTLVGEPDDRDREFEVSFGIDQLELLANAGNRVQEVGRGVIDASFRGFNRDIGSIATGHVMPRRPEIRKAQDGSYYFN
ncbi:MAG: hypothetical protein M3Q70_01025 [bacterium]|nr:hypothetical protein [bacterium]